MNSFEYFCKIYDINSNEIKDIKGIIYAENSVNAIKKLKYYYDCIIESIKIKNIKHYDSYNFENSTIGFSLLIDENGDIYHGEK